jgi:tetratricopeptide (TPR) repeat protein
MRLKTSLLLPLVLSLNLMAYAETPAAAKSDQQSSALDSTLFYQLLVGEMSASGDEPATGFSLMLDAARKTSDAKLFRRAVQIALQARSGESALLAAKAWSQVQPSSKEANHYVLQVLLGMNRTLETAEPLRHEIALSLASEKTEVLWSIPSLFERVSDQALAAATVKRVLAAHLQDPLLGPTAWAVVGRMALSAGDKAGGLNAAANGINMSTQSEHPALLALVLMESDVATAELLVQRHLPHARPEFRMAYIKALLNAKREGDAKTHLESLQNQSPDYPDSWLILGALAFQEGQHNEAKRQLQRYLDLTDQGAKAAVSKEYRRGRTQALFSLAQIAQQAQDFKQAETWLARIDDPNEMLRAQIRRAILIAQQGRLDEALELIEAQPEQREGDAQLKRSSQVQLLKDNQQFVRARQLLLHSLANHPDDLDLMYELSMLHEKLGEIDDMERLLRQLIASRPNDPQAYNALGYSLADRGLRLPEAKILISKAAELAPQDAYIRDSLAWVEFRMGNLIGALELLQNAFKEKPDVEIAAHLGEVLWVMNQTEQAMQVWREGLKLAPDNETLLKTLQRLQVKL